MPFRKKILPFLLISLFSLTACQNLSSSSISSPTSSTKTQGSSYVAPDLSYSVTVNYPDSTPVEKDSVTVSWYNQDQEVCSLPVGENGVAKATLSGLTYSIYLTSLPEGYTYNPNIYSASSTLRSITITLNQCIGSLTYREREIYESEEELANTGLMTNKGRFSLSEGMVEVTLLDDASVLYFSLSPKESATYVIESLAVYNNAFTIVDPSLYFLGSDPSHPFDISAIQTMKYTSGGVGKNFRLEVNTTLSSDFTYALKATSASYPMTFSIQVSKK